MSIDTLNDQDRLLVSALANAKQSLQEARRRTYVEERDVRVILQDIPCESLQRLPISLEVYLPKATLRIMPEAEIDTIIDVIIDIREALIRV